MLDYLGLYRKVVKLSSINSFVDLSIFYRADFAEFLNLQSLNLKNL